MTYAYEKWRASERERLRIRNRNLLRMQLAHRIGTREDDYILNAPLLS